MATAQALLQRKNPEGSGSAAPVVTVRPEAIVRDAAELMNERHIGALVVTDAAGRVIGIFSERDLLKRVVAADKDPHTVRVADVMTRDVIVCRPETRLDEVRQTMREKRIRHIPVVEEGGGLLGMISIGDLNTAEAKVMTETISYLEQFMTRN